MRRPPAAVLAVDGGNSKADVALVARDGRLLAVIRGPTISHQQIGLEAGITRLTELVARAARQAGVDAGDGPVAEIGLYCLAGADFRGEVRLLDAALRATGVARDTTVLNDSRAALRAGASRDWGVVVICGAGMNAAGVGPDGRTARFAALGPISGDRGGGRDMGMSAVGAAARARDGRGPRTALERVVPEYFGLHRPSSLTQALYDGRIAEGRVRELTPLVFSTAGAGDTVAREIVNRLADEIIAMAVAMARRVRVLRREFDVVLAGGVFTTTDAPFYERIAEGIHHAAPRAAIAPLRAPPVMGAALLGLDRLPSRTRRATEQRLRAAFAQGGVPARVKG